MGKKRKGRPSLLDIQKRTLRLQNPNPNSSSRPSTRRNPNPSSNAKRLKLVSDLEDGIPKVEGHEGSSTKATGGGLVVGSGDVTPLPDKKLLEFILDRLQKKDTHGVFSEPVDPEELPDYHDIIEHPMDFGTVKKKLASGDYANLEQFEEDVFLISSNAMRYNAPDTIYFRQARTIHELTKKDFANLRQDSDEDDDDDDDKPEPKVVRRGRPPSKNNTQKIVGNPAAEQASSIPLADQTLPIMDDKTHLSKSSNYNLRKGSRSDKVGVLDSSAGVYQAARTKENCGALNEKRTSRDDASSGAMLNGLSTKYGKKILILEENSRDTYRQPLYTNTSRLQKPSVLSSATLDGEKLVPVGLFVEHVYARSLARFAANLGPIGWEIAARQIRRVLPPGTKFGRGWIGEEDASQHNQSSLASTSSMVPQPHTISPASPKPAADKIPLRLETPTSLAVGEKPASKPFSQSSPSTSNQISDPAEVAESLEGSSSQNTFNIICGGSVPVRTPFQLHRISPAQVGINCSNAGLPNNVSAPSHMARPPIESVAPGMQMSRPQSLDLVSTGNNNNIRLPISSHFEAVGARMDNLSTVTVVKNDFFQAAASNHLDREKTKFGSASTVNFVNNVTSSKATNRLEAERTMLSNTVLLGNRSHMATTNDADAERSNLINPSTKDTVNGCTQEEATCHANAQTEVSCTSSMFNRGNISNQQKCSGQTATEILKLGSPMTSNSRVPLPGLVQNGERFWQGWPLGSKSEPTPPDLNVRFHAPESPASAVLIDSHPPDLALQL